MSDQVQEELKWLRVELGMARRAMGRALQELENCDCGDGGCVAEWEAREFLQVNLRRPASIHEEKARAAGIKESDPP